MLLNSIQPLSLVARLCCCPCSHGGSPQDVASLGHGRIVSPNLNSIVLTISPPCRTISGSSSILKKETEGESYLLKPGGSVLGNAPLLKHNVDRNS